MSQDTLQVEQSETLQQLMQHSNNLPAGNQQKGEEVPPVQETAPQPPAPSITEADTEPEAIQETSEGFEYDGQVFATEKEAFEYLKGRVGQLETETLLAEAREEGRAQAMQYIPQSNQLQQAMPEPEPEIDMDKFYENPAQFLADNNKKVYEQAVAQMRREQQAQTQEQQLWNNFTKAHPDLADFEEDVNFVANQHMDTVKALASRNQKKAMDFVATKVREKFQRYIEARKPTRVLSNTKAGPSVGGNPTVTNQSSQAQNKKPLDFAAQLRQRKYK
jgi:hypothetical protein